MSLHKWQTCKDYIKATIVHCAECFADSTGPTLHSQQVLLLSVRRCRTKLRLALLFRAARRFWQSRAGPALIIAWQTTGRVRLHQNASCWRTQACYVHTASSFRQQLESAVSTGIRGDTCRLVSYPFCFRLALIYASKSRSLCLTNSYNSWRLCLQRASRLRKLCGLGWS